MATVLDAHVAATVAAFRNAAVVVSAFHDAVVGKTFIFPYLTL